MIGKYLSMNLFINDNKNKRVRFKRYLPIYRVLIKLLLSHFLKGTDSQQQKAPVASNKYFI